MKTPAKSKTVTYNPPNGKPRDCRFVEEVVTNNGTWWVMRELGSKETFRARPKAISYQ